MQETMHTYTPILKGKRGEFAALNHLSPTARGRTFPTIEIPPIPTKFDPEEPIGFFESDSCCTNSWGLAHECRSVRLLRIHLQHMYQSNHIISPGVGSRVCNTNNKNAMLRLLGVVSTLFVLLSIGCNDNSTIEPGTADPNTNATSTDTLENNGTDSDVTDSSTADSNKDNSGNQDSNDQNSSDKVVSATPNVKGSKVSVRKSDYGKTINGEDVQLFTCTNANGLVMKMITYGAIMVSMETPDRDGKLENITLSCPDIRGWEACGSYFGATVGRYCNRIAKGKFSLDGKEYTLATNNGPNHLHGGTVGFNRVIWDAEPIESDSEVGVRFTYTSKDGEEGYPGTLKVTATYTLNNDDELTIDFKATTDQATPVNLTNHNYWNLGGQKSGKHFEHLLTIAADQYLAVDDMLIPTGEMTEVTGSPLDFTRPKKMGADLQKIDADPVGYDHCYVLRNQDGDLAFAARVEDPNSGRVMEVHTTQPGLQFYTGNFLDGTEGSGGFNQYEAFCLETQHYPDSPNQEKFPTTILKPGDTFHQTTVHRFSISN